MTSEPVSYLVTALDGTDAEALDRRLAVREAHLAGAQRLADRGELLSGGAILDADGRMIGSSMHVSFADEESFRAWYDAEPYVTGDVWRTVTVQPMRPFIPADSSREERAMTASARADIRIERVDWEHPDAVALRGAQRAELDARYGSDDHEPGIVPTADDVPVFLVAWDGAGAPVVCGGLRPLPVETLGEGIAEIKRMYAAPAARGTGAATALLQELEREAVALGIRRLVLETGTEQPDAVRFYEREGYSSIPLFGHYVGSDLSLCFARDLDVAPGA